MNIALFILDFQQFSMYLIGTTVSVEEPSRCYGTSGRAAAEIAAKPGPELQVAHGSRMEIPLSR